MRLEHPEWAKDCLITYTSIYFDWRHRIRILFGRKVEVRNKIYIEHTMGRTLNEEVRIGVDPLWRGDQRGMCAVSEEDAK